MRVLVTLCSVPYRKISFLNLSSNQQLCVRRMCDHRYMNLTGLETGNASSVPIETIVIQ